MTSLIKGWTPGSKGQDSWMLTDLFHEIYRYIYTCW